MPPKPSFQNSACIQKGTACNLFPKCELKVSCPPRQGKPIIIARPQNHHAGHLKYNKEDPIFITTLEADITKLQGKKMQEGDIEMMLRRLLIFRFHVKLENPAEVPPCGHCFAKLVLNGRGMTPRSSNTAQKRTAGVGFTGDTPEAKRGPQSWSVGDVLQYLDKLDLGHVKDTFINNAVDGELLMGLSPEDLVQELGLTKLQARKIKERLG